MNEEALTKTRDGSRNRKDRVSKAIAIGVAVLLGTGGILKLFDFTQFANYYAAGGKGVRWYQAWTRVKPWEVSAETGYSIGASGVGAALLHVHLAETNRYNAILLPDNPFATYRSS